MPARSLGVWLHGVRVAELTSPRPFRYKLDCTEEGVEAFGDGTNVLTLAFPLGRRPIRDGQYEDRPVAFFLAGLLPEGGVRAQLASRLGVTESEYMPLLEAVGAECAGAVQFLAPGQTPGDGELIGLTDDEVVRLVEEAPTFPAGREPQASLAGIQDKVLVTRTDSGWAWPQAGAVSTHIIKPEPLYGAGLAHLIEAEWWALSVARGAGLPAAQAELKEFGSRRALVIERYDRTPAGKRVHQEDFCQALGLNPADKYETTAMPSPHRLARVMDRLAPASANPTAARQELLAQVTFNTIIGNGDSHAKNYSILLGSDGEARLAPLYDVAPTAYINSRYRQSGLVINNGRDLFTLNIADLVAEATTWGLAPRMGDRVVRETIDGTREAITAIDPPDGLDDLRGRIDAAWTRRSWPGVLLAAVPEKERDGEQPSGERGEVIDEFDDDPHYDVEDDEPEQRDAGLGL